MYHLMSLKLRTRNAFIKEKWFYFSASQCRCTDRRTDGQPTTAYGTSLTSRGKIVNSPLCEIVS